MCYVTNPNWCLLSIHCIVISVCVQDKYTIAFLRCGEGGG